MMVALPLTLAKNPISWMKTLTVLVLPESMMVAPGVAPVTKRELRARAENAGGAAPRRVARLASRFEPGEDSAPPAPQQSLHRSLSTDKDRQQVRAVGYFNT